MLDAVKLIFGYVVTFIIAIPLNGLLVSVTWGWFVAPVFGFREIGVAESIGLTLFLRLAAASIYQPNLEKEKEEKGLKGVAAEALGKAIGAGIVQPIIGLGLAWVFHLILG